jgi:hypothetical protein
MNDTAIECLNEGLNESGNAKKRPWHFARGNSQYHAKKLRVQERFVELLTEYDAKSATAQTLLRIAAQHLDQAITTRNSKTRRSATRAAAKVLAMVAKKPPPEPTLDEALSRR